MENLRVCALPRELTEFLWELVSRELAREGIDRALTRCVLSGGTRDGQPVLNVQFLGRTCHVPGFPPMEKTLLVFAGTERRALYAG